MFDYCISVEIQSPPSIHILPLLIGESEVPIQLLLQETQHGTSTLLAESNNFVMDSEAFLINGRDDRSGVAATSTCLPVNSQSSRAAGVYMSVMDQLYPLLFMMESGCWVVLGSPLSAMKTTVIETMQLIRMSRQFAVEFPLLDVFV